MTTTPDARKRLAEKHADRTAPTPAPVAVPEGVEARIRKDEREKVTRLLMESAGTSAADAAYWVTIGRRHAVRIVRTGDDDPNSIAAPREDARPEAVAAPLPTRDTFPNLADHIRDARMYECEHYVPALDGREKCCAPCLRDRLLPHLIPVDMGVRPTELDDLVLTLRRHTSMTGDGFDRTMQRLLEVASLVPADDEDTVRVPSIADTCCGKCPGACYVDQVTGA